MMSAVKAADVKRGIAVIWENLQCPICLDLMSQPVSTRCDHQFCKFCMTRLLERNKRKETSCPVCKAKVTKRSLQESPGFQKLVEGLQNLVQSYEFDTSTNYFTGLPQRRQGASVETESRDQHCSGENTPTEGDVTEKEATLSSTAEAKDAFAKLMCLENSRPDTAEQECLDVSHGDSAQKSEIKPADPGDVPLTPGACNSQTQQDVTPDDGKRSRRRSKRLCLEPDRIVDKRQKKSVQKVSEWLLKISPASDAEAEGNTEGAPPISTESDGDRGSTASRASTEIHASDNEKAEASPGRAVPCRGLEEQVFGAVYKRERRVSKISKVIRSSSSEREIVPPRNKKEKDETIKAPKRRSRRNVSPAETANEDKEDGAREDETGEENGSLRSPGEPAQVVQSGPDEDAENVEESPEFEVSLKKPGRRSRKMQAVWQDVDRDLAEKESNKKDRKRRVTRSNCDAAKEDESEKSKNAKYAKSLALVSAGTEIIDVREKVPGNPKLIETEVRIESYPSSAELKSPDARRTRRSLRLQEFTAEVQGVTRRTRSKQTLPKAAEEPEKDPTINLDEPREKTGRADTSQPEAVPSEKPDQSVRRRNGCVYNNDFENIEVVQSSEDSAAPKCVSEAEEHSLVSVVPDTVDQDKHILTSSSSTKIENSSPLAAVVPESLPQKRQEASSTETVTSAVEDRETEQEEDTNDSELDTEQLMKTFKATKRKSFYLGSPRTSHNRSKDKSLTQIVEEDKQERVDQPEIPAISPDSDQGLPLNASEIPSQTSQSCVADAASVSLLQVKSPALPSLPKDSSIKTSSARDHPEKVAESQDCARSQVSRPPVNVELGNSIQLFSSTSVTQGEPPTSRSKDSIKSQKSSGILEEPSQANSDVDPNKIPSISLGSTTDSEIRCNNFESSVTPDGLVPHGPEALTTDPVATQTSDKIDEREELSQPRVCRKRKAQRLESSGSESSVDNEDLPPLAQIFKSHQWPSAPDKEPLKTSSKQDGVHAEDRDPRPGSEPVSQGGRSRGEPEAQSTPASQRVTSYQKEKSVEDVNPDDGEDRGVPDPACRDEWISDSQGSVDLFGTPREGEAVAEGVCTNTRLSIESSQYSSEILSTQQKQEMQQELHRLEKMMALVSEALQKKDDDLEDKKDQTEDEDQHSGQRGRARSQRSCKSRKQPSQRSQVKGQPAVPEVLTVVVTEEQKPDESSGDAFGEPAIKNECRAESGGRMELVVSGLSAAEQVLVKKFARKMKASVSSQVTPSTTHIIIKTDGNLVCERTLKYFQGIAGRKWVVSFLWISECFKQGKLLAEVPYEVCGDVVNGLDHSGPRKARTTPDNNLLMRRCEICFQGSFTDMSTDQMELMVEQCGAAVVKDPLMFSRKGMRHQLVVVQPGPDDSQSYYTALQRKATVVTRSWLLDSVAMYTLQNPQDYKP